MAIIVYAFCEKTIGFEYVLSSEIYWIDDMCKLESKASLASKFQYNFFEDRN